MKGTPRGREFIAQHLSQHPESTCTEARRAAAVLGVVFSPPFFYKVKAELLARPRTAVPAPTAGSARAPAGSSGAPLDIDGFLAQVREASSETARMRAALARILATVEEALR